MSCWTRLLHVLADVVVSAAHPTPTGRVGQSSWSPEPWSWSAAASWSSAAASWSWSSSAAVVVVLVVVVAGGVVVVAGTVVDVDVVIAGMSTSSRTTTTPSAACCHRRCRRPIVMTSRAISPSTRAATPAISAATGPGCRYHGCSGSSPYGGSSPGPPGPPPPGGTYGPPGSYGPPAEASPRLARPAAGSARHASAQDRDPRRSAADQNLPSARRGAGAGRTPWAALPSPRPTNLGRSCIPWSHAAAAADRTPSVAARPAGLCRDQRVGFDVPATGAERVEAR